MLKLKDIMQDEVVTVPPELTLREFVEVLTEHGVSGTPVVVNSGVAGVISVTDVLEFEWDNPGVPIAREESPPDTEWGAPAEWSETGDQQPTVFFSEMWEPTEADTLERMRASDAPEWDVLDEYSVADVMTRQILSQPLDATVQEAAAYMLQADVHRLLVIEDGELRGIVTTTDIVRAVADGRLTE